MRRRRTVNALPIAGSELPEEMKEIEQLARAAIGADEQRGDLLAIENLSFQEDPLKRSTHHRR